MEQHNILTKKSCSNKHPRKKPTSLSQQNVSMHLRQFSIIDMDLMLLLQAVPGTVAVPDGDGDVAVRFEVLVLKGCVLA